MRGLGVFGIVAANAGYAETFSSRAAGSACASISIAAGRRASYSAAVSRTTS
jgi:hypothetical protein